MKKLFTIIAVLLITTTVWAQSPQKMSYQAIIRNNSNALVTSKAVGMRISILQGSSTGTSVYVETQTPTTNTNGLLSIEIGNGTSFDKINWADGPYFIKTETDPTGGTVYTISGTSQLMSVPYALFSANGTPGPQGPQGETGATGAAGINGTNGAVGDKGDTGATGTFQPGTEAGQILYWDGGAWITINPGVNNQTLSFCLGVPTWGPCPRPIITTATASSITSTTATSGGNITSDAGAPVTSRGICWSITPGLLGMSENLPPTSFDNTIDGTGTGPFTSSIIALQRATTYFVRAYATNIVGTGWGSELSFKTLAILPTIVNTWAAAYITSTSAMSGGHVTSDGGETTVHGVCWSTSPGPDVTGNHTIDGTGTGTFISTMTGLTLGTTYYVRAYATNSIGTVYGPEVSFTAAMGIGENYQGGIIAYLLQLGDPGYNPGIQHGLIAAPSDQSIGIQWYNVSFTTTGATATAIGTGNANTTAIITSQGNTGSYAAKLCADLVFGGYSDWYLPSKDELNKLFINRTAILIVAPPTGTNIYWSSSEISLSNAWEQNFYNGGQGSGSKFGTFYVRAIRAF